MLAVKEKVLEKSSSINQITRKVLRFWLPVVIWAIVIFLFSARPVTPATQIFWKDFVVKKSAHVFEYAVLTILLYRALKAGGIEKKEAGVYSIILAILYGLSDEFHQSFIPGRDAKVRDVIFDAAGSILVIYALWKYLPKAPKRLRLWAKRLQVS